MGIIVRGLRKRFGGTTVVDGVSFEIRRGELTALLGPSGGGKSTVLRIIAGLEEPDAGEVILGGRVATHARVQDRGIGFVFQSYALFRHMTVRENVAFGLTLRRLPRPERARVVDELLQLVQLSGLGERYPSELSGGQRQRVAIARSTIMRPALILADEPTGNLDQKTGAEILALFDRLSAEGKTLLVITHDMSVASRFARRIRIQDGVVSEERGA